MEVDPADNGSRFPRTSVSFEQLNDSLYPEPLSRNRLQRMISYCTIAVSFHKRGGADFAPDSWFM